MAAIVDSIIHDVCQRCGVIYIHIHYTDADGAVGSSRSEAAARGLVASENGEEAK